MVNTVEFYVPSTNSEQIVSTLLLAERTDLIAAEMVRLGGAATATPGTGYWPNAEGRVITEPVNILKTYTMLDILQDILALAKKYCRAWGQEAVLVVYNGTPYLEA